MKKEKNVNSKYPQSNETQENKEQTISKYSRNYSI